MTRTLLYGGSFDPPHVAHVRLPFNAMESLGFDRVLYVPAFQSPLKGPTHTSDTHRLAMLELALTDCVWAEISTIELERGGTSYTIDTIESLQHGDDEYRLLIGADQWGQFEQWKRWEDILRLANPVIMPRVGFDVCDERLLTIDYHPGISTDIREFLKEGTDIRGIVTSEVKEYITEHQLYL
jgi:nicotinate-nucleotide adenylyltransferase